MPKISVKIADIPILIQSKFFLRPLDFDNREDFRFRSFLYQGRKTPEIIIDVEIVKELPKYSDGKVVFITYHFQDGSENWRLLRKGSHYIYTSPLQDKKQVMLINSTFDRVKAYLLPKNPKRLISSYDNNLVKKYQGFFWDISDIIYDFLQVLLINYLALIKRDGVFVHGMGVKDRDKKGILFAGKSGTGKTTLAKIYHHNSKLLVLNDDRIILRRIKNNFYIYGSPWHGDFSDYLDSDVERARLKTVLFLKKSNKNAINPITLNQAFGSLYSAMFPTFWDKAGIKNISELLIELLNKVDYFRLRFRKDKSVLGFVDERV